MVDGKTHRLLLKKEDRSSDNASESSAHCQFYLDGKKNRIPDSFLQARMKLKNGNCSMI